MRLAIYSSGKATRMKKAIELGTEDFVHDIKIFFTEDSQTEYLRPFLESKDIEYICQPYEKFEQERLKSREIFSNRFLQILKDKNIDYVLCNGRHILSGRILDEYKNKIINFHGALLPSYAGEMQLDKMLEKKEFLVGTTAHFIDEGVDTGPIIMEAVIPSYAFYENGYDIVIDTQVNMMHKIYKLLKDKRIEVQNHCVEIRGADYNSFSIFPKI